VDNADVAFWFYFGQLRGRSDTNKSTDESARSAITALNMQLGEKINKYALRELDVLRKPSTKLSLLRNEMQSGLAMAVSTTILPQRIVSNTL